MASWGRSLNFPPLFGGGFWIFDFHSRTAKTDTWCFFRSLSHSSSPLARGHSTWKKIQELHHWKRNDAPDHCADKSPKKPDKPPWKSHGGSKPLLQKTMSKTSKSHNPTPRDENLSGYLDFWNSTVCPTETNHWNPKSSLGTGRWNIFLKGGLRGDFKFRSIRSVSVWSMFGVFVLLHPLASVCGNSKCKNSQCHYPVRSLDRRSHLLNNLPSRMDSVYFQNPEIGGEQFQHQWFTNQNITSELCIDRFHCALGMPNAWAQVFAVALSKASQEPTSHGCDTCHK